MRKDQVSRLQDLAERVCDVFLEEADPDTWSGAGNPLASLDAETRGNRYWDKKNCIQTGTLLARVIDLRDRDLAIGGKAPMPDEEADKEIKRFEKLAKEWIGAIKDGAAAGKR